jgi:hypothetical protein
MKKIIFGAIVATFLFSSPLVAQAETKDVAKTTCKELLSDQDNMPLLIMWIDGYLSAESDNTVFSQEWQQKLGKHLGEFCAKNPDKTIMDAMNALPSE